MNALDQKPIDLTWSHDDHTQVVSTLTAPTLEGLQEWRSHGPECGAACTACGATLLASNGLECPYCPRIRFAAWGNHIHELHPFRDWCIDCNAPVDLGGTA